MHALVDGYRAHRRVRKDETHRLVQLELGNDRLEVVAVGAEAVQPDDAGSWICSGIDFNRFHGVHYERKENEERWSRL